LEKNVEISILLDFYGSLLTKGQVNAIKEHYDEDQSFGEIAERLGKSRQSVHDSVRKGVSALYNYEKKLGTMKRYLDFDKKVAKLQDKLQANNDVDISEIQAGLDELSKLWE
jgi:predicted DNA-binding protein YlxM (UPF0122 family)